jgi:hypothetical protein
MKMIAEFEDKGVRFRYPTNWRLEREDTENGWTVSIQSPGTAFVTVTLDEESPTTEAMAQTALDALRDEYPELEADDRLSSIAGQPAVGHDIRFFSLDLTNTCWTGSLYCASGTLLILCQTSDLELEASEPVLRAICASMEVEE